MQLGKAQEIKVYKMKPIYLTDTWTHGNIFTDNDLKKTGALLQTRAIQRFKEVNKWLWEIRGDDNGVTVVTQKDTSLWQWNPKVASLWSAKTKTEY